MIRPAKVRAWAVVSADGVVQETYFYRRDAVTDSADYPGTNHVIRLVEHDPARDAVVRAAVELVKDRFETSGDELVAAVERLQRKGRK